MPASTPRPRNFSHRALVSFSVKKKAGKTEKAGIYVCHREMGHELLFAYPLTPHYNINVSLSITKVYSTETD